MCLAVSETESKTKDTGDLKKKSSLGEKPKTVEETEMPLIKVISPTPEKDDNKDTMSTKAEDQNTGSKMGENDKKTKKHEVKKNRNFAVLFGFSFIIYFVIHEHKLCFICRL